MSVVVSALTNEPTTPHTIAWLDAHSDTGFAVSDWVITEFSSALSIKLRVGKLDLSARALALKTFAGLRATSFAHLTFGSGEFLAAANFADNHTLSLRCGDALHLAICAAHGATLRTLDDRQSAAGLPLEHDFMRLNRV
jgi:predicted nucleic acid-binding protein